MSGDVNAMLDYFESYRQKKQQYRNFLEEIKETRARMEKMQQESQKLGAELRSMQRIITAMIDDDMDPVEVKLKNDLSSMIDTMWNDGDVLVADEVSLSIMGGMMGATGAISAATTTALAPSTTAITSISSMYPYTSASASKITSSKYSLTTISTP